MNTHRILTILITAFLLATSAPCFAATSASKSGCSLVIKLKDGSHFSGKSLDDGWQFHSDALGDFKPIMSGIRSIEMATDGDMAQLIGSNGDKLNVRFAAATLPVDASFGKIDVPVKSIRSIEVLAAGNLKTLPAGLVALWSAEGNGTDLIGEHNAVAQGNVTYEPGLVGKAFGLDGHTAYLKIPASPALDVGAGDGLTITGWIRPSAFDETPGHGARGPIIEWDSDTNDGVSLWANGGNSLSASLKTPTADGRTTGLQTVNGTLHSGQWQLVAFTYDKSSGAATLYIDGVAVKSENFGSVRAETTYPINIGRRTGQPIGNGDSFGGLVDQLALFNRALSAAEIIDIYEEVPLPKRHDPQPAMRAQVQKRQLIGWWPLNECEGTLVNDHSSSTPPHNGKVIGGPIANGPRFNSTYKHKLGGDENSLSPQAEVSPQGGEGQANDEKIWDNIERGQTSLACDGLHYVSLGNIYQGRYEEITIACWIKHQSSGWQDVVERGSWGDADGIGLCMDYSGKSVTFGHYPEGIKSKAVVQDNRWHHVAGTMRREGDDYVYSIYVDGKLDNTAVGCSRGIAASTGKWTIGARDGGSWSYQGLVNDVRLYDSALTEEDIKKIFLEKKYQAQTQMPAPQPITPQKNPVPVKASKFSEEETISIPIKEQDLVAQLRVMLTLRDGSIIVGVPRLKNIGLVTEFGGTEVPLALLRSIQLDDKMIARLSFRNDDRLSGVWDAKLFQVDGMVGRLNIPLTNIVKIGVSQIMPKASGSILGTNGIWKLRKMEGGPRAWGTATVLQDGTVLLAGGHGTSGDDHLSSCLLFDPASETFRPTGFLHTCRHGHTATLLKDGRVLVVGGYNKSSSWLTDTELYDPDTGQWKVLAPPSGHGTSHSATLLADGRVFVLGGAIGSGQHSGLGDIFDPRTDTWTSSRARFEPRGGHAATLLASGEVLIAGGDGGAKPDSAVIYDPASDTVRAIKKMPMVRNFGIVVALSDNRFLFFGGAAGSDAVTDCTIGDFESGTWTTGPSLNSGHILAAHVPSGNDGCVFLLGGSALGEVGKPLRKVEFYDAAKNRWVSFPDMNQPRSLTINSSVLLNDGRIAIFGGRNESSGLDTYEIYSSPSAVPARR